MDTVVKATPTVVMDTVVKATPTTPAGGDLTTFTIPTVTTIIITCVCVCVCVCVFVFVLCVCDNKNCFIFVSECYILTRCGDGSR